MASPKDEYKKLKQIEELRGELLDAFAKNAAIRAERHALEKQLQRINEKLSQNDVVNKVLSKAEYKNLEIANCKEFLGDIEREADMRFQAARKTSNVSKANQAKQPRKRSSETAKRSMLTEIVRSHKGQEFLVADISKYLKSNGISTPATTWLKSLAIPASAIPDVQPGNRRAGKRFIPSEVEWIDQ